jgi:hypothetical protein
VCVVINHQLKELILVSSLRDYRASKKKSNLFSL